MEKMEFNLTNTHIFQVVQLPTGYPFLFWGASNLMQIYGKFGVIFP